MEDVVQTFRSADGRPKGLRYDSNSARPRAMERATRGERQRPVRALPLPCPEGDDLLAALREPAIDRTAHRDFRRAASGCGHNIDLRRSVYRPCPADRVD